MKMRSFIFTLALLVAFTPVLGLVPGEAQAAGSRAAVVQSLKGGDRHRQEGRRRQGIQGVRQNEP